MWNFVLGLLLASTLAAEPEPTARYEWYSDDGTPRWSASIEPPPAADETDPLLGQRWAIPFPELTYPLIDGTELTHEDLAGKVVMLDFWASWCGPCLEQLPKTEEMWQGYRDRDLIVIAVNVGESRAVAEASSKALGLTMPIATYTPEIRDAFNVSSFPTVVVADRASKIRARWDRFDENTALRIHAVIERMFGAEPKPQEPIAQQWPGSAPLRVRWMRDFPANVDATMVAPDTVEDRYVWIATGRQIHLLDERGRTAQQLPGRLVVGELLPSPLVDEENYTALGFRIGGRELVRYAMPDGRRDSWKTPAPILSARWDGASVLIGTMKGAQHFDPETETWTPILDEKTIVRGLRPASEGWTALVGNRSTRQLQFLDPEGQPQQNVELSTDLWRILGEQADGFGLPSSRVRHVAIGNFFGDDSRQVALATASYLLILNLDDGAVRYRAAWEGIQSLSAGDPIGDGVDRLVVAWGQRAALLEYDPQ